MTNYENIYDLKITFVNSAIIKELVDVKKSDPPNALW